MVAISVKELTVITKCKELSYYVFFISEKIPKKYRFSLTNRMQNTSLDIITYLYTANDIFVRNETDIKRREERIYYQRKAMTCIKLLGYLSHIAYEQNAILQKQFEHICQSIYVTTNMLGAWINSELRNIKNMGQKISR